MTALGFVAMNAGLAFASGLLGAGLAALYARWSEQRAVPIICSGTAMGYSLEEAVALMSVLSQFKIEGSKVFL